MCVGGKVGDALLRPHRLFGGPSLIDPMLHPNDPYNLEKNPLSKVDKAATPDAPVERQPYKDAPAKASILGAVDQARRQRNMGVVTSSQGVTTPASTTKNPLAAGVGQSSPAPVVQQPAPAATLGPWTPSLETLAKYRVPLRFSSNGYPQF